MFKNLSIAPLPFLLCRSQEVMQQRVGVCVGEDAGQQRHHVHPSIGGTDGNVDGWHDLSMTQTQFEVNVITGYFINRLMLANWYRWKSPPKSIFYCLYFNFLLLTLSLRCPAVPVIYRTEQATMVTPADFPIFQFKDV